MRPCRTVRGGRSATSCCTSRRPTSWSGPVPTTASRRPHGSWSATARRQGPRWTTRSGSWSTSSAAPRVLLCTPAGARLPPPFGTCSTGSTPGGRCRGSSLISRPGRWPRRGFPSAGSTRMTSRSRSGAELPATDRLWHIARLGVADDPLRLRPGRGGAAGRAGLGPAHRAGRQRLGLLTRGAGGHDRDGAGPRLVPGRRPASRPVPVRAHGARPRVPGPCSPTSAPTPDDPPPACSGWRPPARCRGAAR